MTPGGHASPLFGDEDDRVLLSQLATLPAPKQQPNLVFAALRWHGERPGTPNPCAMGSGARWISFEGRDVVPLARELHEPVTLDTSFVAALDRVPSALASAHGDIMTLLEPPPLKVIALAVEVEPGHRPDSQSR